MAMKLYPPNIEGTIPAFYGTALAVPFSMNKAVAKKDIYGMQIKIKAIQSGAYILTAITTDIEFDPACIAYFNFSEYSISKLKVGQHYKIQIAYIAKDEDETIGYFSTAAVVKYTSQPTVILEGLKLGEINSHRYDYVGVYTNRGDSSERVYSYCFNLYDNNNNLLQTSGEKIHNTELDIDLKEQHDVYNIEQDLEINKSYFLEYIVTTINNLQVTSGKYRIMQKRSINPEIKADLVPKLNFENGYIDLNLVGQRNKDNIEYAATGAFKILRASDEDNYQTWHEVLKFALYGQQPSRWMWKDFTVKQGVSYRYALQQYNDAGLTSNRLESEPIYADFEHAFLYDGKRQLKIKYNPKVGGFKNNLLESKLNTIGNQYPFIFRNGNVKYKEFSISGLISCQLDDEFLFVDEKDLEDHDKTSNLISQNIASEREFKLSVLEWLNNGQPKLFRSSTEGNYIVRLMNVSLTPNDTLGRMLHTFNSTAYEIAEYSYKNLTELGLISVSDPTTSQLRWDTVELDAAGVGAPYKNILKYKAVSLRFEGMIPGDKIWIDDGIKHQTPIYDNYNNVIISNNGQVLTEGMFIDPNTKLPATGYEVVIGVTGSYIIDLNAEMTINKVYFRGSPDSVNAGHQVVHHQGTLTYAYYSKVQNRFDSISEVSIVDAPLEQYMGEHDIINEIEDVKTEIQGFYWIHCMLRDIQNLYEKNHVYYTTEDYTTQFNKFDPYVLYLVKKADADAEEQYVWKDGASPDTTEYAYDTYSSKIYFNGNEMDLKETREYTLKAPKDIESFAIGNGVMAEVSYQKQIVDYSIEDDTTIIDKYQDSLAGLKAKAERAAGYLYAAIYHPNTIDQNITVSQYRQIYKDAYNLFIEALELKLAEKEEAQGDVAT